MQYKKFGNTYLVRMDLNEEVMQNLKTFCEQEGICLAHVEALGAASHAILGVYDLKQQAYHQEDLSGFMEITGLTGNVTRKDGEIYLHLHGTLADQKNGIHGGHVIELTIGATCEMFVTVLQGEVNRVRDGQLGINLISI